MSGQRQHSRPSTSPLAAALTALQTLQPADESTRRFIMKSVGFEVSRGSEAVPLIDTDQIQEREITGMDDDEKKHRGLRAISTADQPPPVVPSELDIQHDIGTAPPSWLDNTPTIPLPSKVSDPFSEPLEPLLAPNYSRAIISRLACQILPRGEIDIDSIIGSIEKSLPFTTVPRRRLPSLALGVQLLIDTHEGMQPFSMDIRDLLGEILCTVGWDRVQVLRFKGCPSWGIQCHPLQDDDRYHLPAAGCPVLIITDLGISAVRDASARSSMADWIDFIDRLKRNDTRVTVLIPYASKHWPKTLSGDMNMVVWDRSTTATSLRRQHRPLRHETLDDDHVAFLYSSFASIHPDAVRLGILASLATRIEPQLLRRLRLELAADLDVGMEAVLWHSDLVQEHAPTGIVMNTEIRTLLQRRLVLMPQLFNAAHRIIRQVHRGSAPALQLEEELVYQALKGNTSRVKELLRSMVATLISPEREGIAGWTGQVLLRIPPEIKDLEETRLLAAGAALRLGDSSILQSISSGGNDGLHWLMPRKREIEVSINLRRGAIEFGPMAMRAAHKILVPDIPTVIIELQRLDDTEQAPLQYLRIQPGQRRIYEIEGDTFDLNIIGGRRYRLATAEEARLPSSKKFAARNRAPRVQITYEVELYDALKLVELPFIMGVLADLSGANGALLPPVPDRRFLDIDVDNFDERMAAIQPGVAFVAPNRIDGSGEIAVELAFSSLKHFHPDVIVDQIFSTKALKDQRVLIEALLKEIAEDPLINRAVGQLVSSGNILEGDGYDKKSAADLVLKDVYEALQKSEMWRTPRGELIRQALPALVEGYRRFSIKPTRDPQDSIRAMIVQIDTHLSEQLREIMHHRDFQSLEATWRGLYYLVANTETDDRLKIKCLNISKDELRQSLIRYKGENFEHGPVFKTILIEFDAMDGEPFGCLLGDFYFDHRSPDVEVLNEVARIAVSAHAPFITGAAPSVLQMDSWSELSVADDLSTLFNHPDYAAWHSLRESEDARYIYLTMPRFLARLPYGRKTEPVEAFDFEEEIDDADSGKYVWANSAYTMAANINRAFKLYGWCSRIRGVESGGAVEALPVHTFPTDDGGVGMKGPTEIGIADRREAELANLGFMPLVHRKNSDFAAFIGAQSLQKPAVYDDPDASANANLAVRLPYLFPSCRFTHYLKCIIRDKIGSFQDRDAMQKLLQKWIMQYVDPDPAHSSETVKARKPLAAAEIVIEEDENDKYHIFGWLYLRPHYQIEGLTVSLRTIFRLPSFK